MRVKEYTPHLDKVQIRLRGLTSSERYSIGNIAKRDIRDNFITRGANINRTWEDLKYRKGEPLRDHGDLFKQINFRSEGNKIDVISAKMVGNTNVAAVHNFGTDRAGRNKNVQIPQREFMKLSEGAWDEIKLFVRNRF